ncbi:MAG: hypothetical protein ACKOZY_07425 [Flavobacteriales bacterium]
MCLFIVALFAKGHGQDFTEEQRATANTAVNATELKANERDVIMYVNLARLYPKQFSKLYIEPLPDNTYADPIMGTEVKKSYKTSLISTLQKMKPVGLLQYSVSMHEVAECWVKESGPAGIVGHKRRKCKEGFLGECCSYGHDDALAIVVQLLLDVDVPSLGHRKIILDPSYATIGTSVGSHAKYDFCAVLDFY